MTPLPAPAPGPAPTGSIVLRSPATRRSSVAVIILLVLMVPLGLVALIIFLALIMDLGYIGLILALLMLLLLVLPLGLGVWATARHRGTSTTVDAHGLTLRAPGAPARTFAWEEVHGRVMVKVVTQHTPALVGSSAMGLVCIAFDGGEMPLPGTMTQAYNTHTAFQQSYQTAMRILAYDPWRQGEPLTASESTYAPWGPALYRPYPHYLHMFRSFQ